MVPWMATVYTVEYTKDAHLNCPWPMQAAMMASANYLLFLYYTEKSSDLNPYIDARN